MVGQDDSFPWSDDVDEPEVTVGFRLFTVPGLVDAAATAWRRNTALFLSLTLLGLLPLASLLLGLEYLASVRRLFATTYEYDYVVIIAAVVLPVVLGWRALCGAAMNRAAIEILRREELSASERAAAPELTATGLLGEASQRGLHVLFVGMVRTVLVWVIPASVVVLSVRADPDMEEFVLYAVGVSTFIVSACSAALVSGMLMQWMPSAALSVHGRRAKKGSETVARGIALSFLLAFLFILLAINLHLFVQLLLFLGDALFALDVSYWIQFFSLTNGLWFWTLWLIAAVLMEPIAQVSGAYLWVDGRVRRDALDLRGALARVKAGAGRRALAARSAQNPSEHGDRATLGIVVALTAAALCFGGSPSASAQDLVGYADGDADIREARQLLSESGQYSWADLQELQDFVILKEEGAGNEGDRVYWREVRAAVAEVRSSYGDDRDRAHERLLVMLKASEARPQEALDPGAVEARLAEVLTQEEFVDLAAKEVDRNRPGVDLRRRKWDRPKEARETCCESGEWNKATPREPSGVDAPDFQVGSEIFKVLAIILIVVALGLLLLAVLRRFQARGAAPAGQTLIAESIEHEEPTEEDALAFTPEDWQTRAVRLADSGDYRLAIRSLYLALLVALHRRQLIAYDEAKTNWEYETELRARLRRRRSADRAPLDGFNRLTSVFDLVWYGERDADRTMFEQCLGWARAVNTDGGDS